MGIAVGYALQKLLVYLSTVVMICYAILQMSLVKLMSIISPGLAKTILLKLGEKCTMTQNPKFKYEDWAPTFFSTVFIKTVFTVSWCSLGLEAFEGYTAPDTPVYTMDGQKTSILRFLKGNRPLVLSFGSCT